MKLAHVMMLFLLVLLVLCVFVASPVVQAEVAWTCKREQTPRGNIIYNDCGYREITTIKLACQVQKFTDHMGHAHEHLVCRARDQVYFIADNVG